MCDKVAHKKLCACVKEVCVTILCVTVLCDNVARVSQSCVCDKAVCERNVCVCERVVCVTKLGELGVTKLRVTMVCVRERFDNCVCKKYV